MSKKLKTVKNAVFSLKGGLAIAGLGLAASFAQWGYYLRKGASNKKANKRAIGHHNL